MQGYIETTEDILDTTKQVSHGGSPPKWMEKKKEIVNEGKHFFKVRDGEGPKDEG
jgi:hypothetical protein